jgi:hypothetical protein
MDHRFGAFHACGFLNLIFEKTFQDTENRKKAAPTTESYFRNVNEVQKRIHKLPVPGVGVSRSWIV